jgi:hypothetical protein
MIEKPHMIQWKPTLGGWLTMLNCIGWLILATLPSNWWRWPYPALHSCWLALSLPVAWICFTPTMGFRRDHVGIAATCCVVGFNSFLWGYGLAALLRRLPLSGRTNNGSSTQVW